MVWSSSTTGDRTKGYPGSSLVVTTAWVALDFSTSCHGRWSGVGTLEWGFGFFWIGDQGQVPQFLARPRESGAEVRRWLILVSVHLLDEVSRNLEQQVLHRLGHWVQWIWLWLMEPVS
jgi:hypothetical protein